ncbi:MAG TPA: CADD family putative folate metabolism protein [Bacteroidota bacterium]|nr:CADD family putative folate metabolism protein [Bacteroidota bacterium]
MNHGDILRRLDELIQTRSILNHPFYRAWQSGALSREQLAVYAKSYYPHVAAFPDYLRSAIAKTTDAVVRTELEKNLSDELTNPAPHPELWLDFAEGLGRNRESVSSAAPTPATKRAVDAFHRLSAGGTAGALAALYAYESQQPGVSTTKMDGLRKFYDIHDSDTLAYFEVHAEKDIEHSAGERAAMLRFCDAGASAELILNAANKALDAYWGLLDGICAETGIETSC